MRGRLRFIDLFCGIGGFRLAFERAGCECVFSSGWNAMAQITYEANFGERPHRPSPVGTGEGGEAG
jgi:DNA (cytosine-5)-methyltransferase 1